MLPMTVTVFSRYTSGETLIWQPVILVGVLYRPAQGHTLTATGPEFSGKTGTLWIPYRPGRVSGQEFFSATDKTGLFTLRPGDFILSGTVSDTTITGELRERYPNARRILTVTERRYGTSLDHWEVTVA